MKKNNFFLTSRKGFTLAEILVAVLIMIILVTMAVPMYDRAIEKSRVADVSVGLKRLSDAKLRTMMMRDLTTYNKEFGVLQVDATLPGTEAMKANQQDAVFAPAANANVPASQREFIFSLYPNNTYPNSVCAKRTRGDNAGTIFLYVGEEGEDYCHCSTTPVSGVLCEEFCGGRSLFCKGQHCDAYGMSSIEAVGNCDTESLIDTAN